jgi:hypothetical protein
MVPEGMVLGGVARVSAADEFIELRFEVEV